MKFPRREMALSIAGVIVALVVGVLFWVFRKDTPVVQLPDGRMVSIDRTLLTRVEWTGVVRARSLEEDKSYQFLRRIGYLATRRFYPYFSIPNPATQSCDFVAYVSYMPHFANKRVFVSDKLMETPRTVWLGFSFGVRASNAPARVTERRLVEAMLDAVRTNGVDLFDEAQHGKKIMNYPCVIINSRKEMRILTAGEFEAVSNNR